MGNPRLLQLLDVYVGRWTEEGLLVRVDGKLFLRTDDWDKSLATLEDRHLVDLLSQLGHSGLFP